MNKDITTIGGIMERIQAIRDAAATDTPKCSAAKTVRAKGRQVGINFCTLNEGHEGKHKSYTGKRWQ